METGTKKSAKRRTRSTRWMIDTEDGESRLMRIVFEAMGNALRNRLLGQNREASPFGNGDDHRYRRDGRRHGGARTVRAGTGTRTRNGGMRQRVRHRTDRDAMRRAAFGPYDDGGIGAAGMSLGRDGAVGQECQQHSQSQTPIVPTRTPHVPLPRGADATPLDRITSCCRTSIHRKD